MPQLQIKAIGSLCFQEKEPGCIFPGDTTAAAELLYVDKGSLHWVSEGKDIYLKKGDMVLCPAGVFRMHYADAGVAPSLVAVEFTPAPGFPLESISNQKHAASRRVTELLRQLVYEYKGVDSFSRDMAAALLTQLLILVHREVTISGRKPEVTNRSNNENRIIRSAQQYIAGHIREKLTVPQVARQIAVSPSYLTALFQKHLQLSPGEYIRRMKLQESKVLIRSSGMNFTEIAAALQYSTVHHFSRQFKAHFGITPTEYAKSLR